MQEIITNSLTALVSAPSKAFKAIIMVCFDLFLGVRHIFKVVFLQTIWKPVAVLCVASTSDTQHKGKECYQAQLTYT